MEKINKYLYLFGMYVYNPLINQKFKFLLNSQYWNEERILDWQINSCKKLLIHAYENSPFYKKFFKDVSFQPQNFRSLEDLKFIPTTSKSLILENSTYIQNFVPKEKHFYSETSGSSGTPLIFYRNATWDAWHRASVLRGYHWYGINPWERNGYLWGYNFSFKKRLKVRLLDALQNRFRLFSYNDQEIFVFIKKLESAKFLGGYSSMIYEIAKQLNGMSNSRRFSLKMIKGTSEKIFDYYQQEVERAFGQRIISEYGSAEAGIIAFECPSGTQHLNMETAIVEVVDNEIVVTNLVSYSFPIIRYKLGDFVQLSSSTKCSCGVMHGAINEVFGRVGRVIYGKTQRYPSLTLYYVFKNLAMERNLVFNYQARQNVKGAMEILIEQHVDREQHRILISEFEKYFSSDIELKIIDDVSLKSTEGKRLDFISSIIDG
ncbi:hypothetical protein Despr_0355 [Desulfobulbus propionicus DSM 2032]|uniref:Capsule biosynthesis protein CapK n=1 Tax=Desulfobulbus propionicus (strain ATCC 33891 / DSM 2032 / VKM B-1956 / 1pr3) TaxID=577650 RepID=A0A7U4DN01_DESPD|nr:phenylacetate--CoA ligase family protein [Desulfobulbus propionicus]ADW16537.1 hypothetical protein Despr_0355 [Desulfobulbus propionicus DSM 2032]